MAFEKKIGSELRDGTYIANELALPNASTGASGVFYDAGIMNGLEIVITAATAISVSANKTLSIELKHCDTASGSFTTAAPIASFSGAKSFAAGDEIARFVPASKTKRCMKLSFTDDEDLSAAKISAWLVRKG